MNLMRVCQLYRPKVSGWVAHNGLELVMADGTRKVFHNSPITGPTICSYDDFAENLPVTEKRDVTINLDEVSQRISALLEQKRKYHVVDFNCELHPIGIGGREKGSLSLPRESLMTQFSSLIWLY